MRKLIILKTLIDFFFIVSLVGIIGIVALLSILLISGESLPMTINGDTIEVIDAGAVVVIVFSVIAYMLFVYIIFLFKKIIRFFMRTEIFHEYVIKAFNQIGICFLLICAMVYIPNMVYMQGTGSVEFDLIGDLFNSFWFLLIMGLFFMVLSSVFKIGKHAKEENELTV